MSRVLAFGVVLLAAWSVSRADDKGVVVEIDGLKSAAPAVWKKQELPKDPMFKSRLYQFKIEKAAGDKEGAELRVIHLGKGQGGDDESNIKRWKDEFKSPAADKVKVEKMKVGKVDVLLVDVEGTYLSKFPPFAPNAKITEKPEWRIINVQFGSPNGPYYFKLMGPAKTVSAQKKAFDEWVKAFK